MQSESMTLPTDVLKQHPNDVFIETGSYDERTIQQALDCGFPNVVSIELSDKYFNICVQRFANDKRVKLYKGDSADKLSTILAALDTQATFWLDAHWQEEYIGKVAAPLLYELEQLAQHPIKTHTIIIDDVRLMGTPYWRGLASQQEVIKAVYTINPHYQITYHDSKAAQLDIMVAKVLSGK